MKKKKSKLTDKEDSANSTPSQIDNLLPANSGERKALESIFTILLKSSSIDFSHYRHTTVLRRMSRRMIMCKQNAYTDYRDFLRTNMSEVEKLYDDLLLSVTQFFRDPHIFETLKKRVFPQIVKNRSARTPIRIWVPGCSTGEEVYSLAICLYEFIEQSKTKVPIQFFGTDLVERHIVKARAGLYSDRIFKDVSKERLDCFFDRTPEGLKVTKHIREMCVFAVQNITQDPPFSNIDLVSCRNVLIYFDVAFQKTAIPLFHFALNPSGFLLLGTSETMGKFPQFFNVVDQKSNLYTKRSSRVKPDYEFPIYQTFTKLKDAVRNKPVPTTGKDNITEVSQQVNDLLLENYAPPGVLIDSNMLIHKFVGHVFPYLGPVSGEASLKLSKMVGEGLMPDLYVAIEEAKKKKEKIRKKNISFKQNNKVKITDINVFPILDSVTNETNFLILFNEPEQSQTSTPDSNEQNGPVDSELSHLKQELQLTKDHLQAIIEEKDEVNQELWASNEEVQSTNEELQSVNEEMEAAKEELESSNEELLALNEELLTKNTELAASNDFSVNLLETANTIVLALDTSANIITFNKYAEKLTGHIKEDVIGRNWFDLFIPLRDKESIPKVFKEVLKSMPEVSQHENHIVMKSGMERLISWSNNILQDGSGNVEGILSIGMDITEHNLAEKALKESQAKLLRSQYVSKMGDFDWNIQTGEVSWSEGMYRLLKYDKDEGIDYKKINKDIHHPEDIERVTKWLNDSIASGEEELIPHEYRLICKDGELIYVQTNGRIEYRDGKALKLFGTCVDISARKKAEREKIKAQEYAAGQEKQALVGQVAGKIAHDFNNILGVIMGNAELSLLDCNDPEIKKTFELIFEQTMQGKNLTKNLVAFAKDQELKQEFFNINKKISLVLNLLKKDLKDIEIVKDFKEGLPSLLADPGMIEHALINLIQNSIHALGMVEYPRITIRTFCVDDSWIEENYIDENICFEIEDNGCGIPKEHLKNIYLPSFTLKGKKDVKGFYNGNVRGTGYGMSNVKKYIEQHKGDISVKSIQGKSTKFLISLPIIKKELTNKEKAAIRKSKSYVNKNILLVEDEPAIAGIQHRILTHEPFRHKVDIAIDGQIAIDLFEKNIYDFISLDYLLPGDINGMDIYNHIRKTNKIIPMLFISGNIEFIESIKELKQKDPNIDHLSKPCLNKEYLNSINELLDRVITKKEE